MNDNDKRRGSGNPKQSYWRLVWRQFRRNTLAMVGLVVLLLLALIALAAPFLANDVPIYMVKEGRTYWFPNLITYETLEAENFYRTASRWQPQEGERASRPIIPYSPYNHTLRDSKQPPSARHWLGTDDRGRSVVARLIWGTRWNLFRRMWRQDSID